MASNTPALREAVFCTDDLANDNNDRRHKIAECAHDSVSPKDNITKTLINVQ